MSQQTNHWHTFSTTVSPLYGVFPIQLVRHQNRRSCMTKFTHNQHLKMYSAFIYCSICACTQSIYKGVSMRILTYLVAMFAFGCGTDSSDERADTSSAPTSGAAMADAINEAGVVTSAWSAFCVAEFTSDYSVKDFDDELFTARAGERYRQKRPSNGTGLNAPGYAEPYFSPATALYLRGRSPKWHDVAHGRFLRQSADRHVFRSLFRYNIYPDDALTEEACTLPAGTYAMGGGGYFTGGEGK